MYLLYQIRITTPQDINVTSSVIVDDSNTTTQNITFKDANPSYKYVVEQDTEQEHCIYGATKELPLNEFFKRPIKIYSGPWTINATSISTTTINPWTLFFTNKRVMNRISNYNMFRSTLNVKIVLNGTPFHYGKAIVSYLPLHNYDRASKLLRSTPVLADLTALTTRPHAILDPTCDQGAVLKLPFFWYKNWCNIVDNEWANLGTLRIDVMSPLFHANGGTSDVTISMYAWTDDIILASPTTMNPTGLVTQSGDEYGKRVVSKTASAVAMAMGMLSEVPLIGPYARATSLVAEGVSKVAHIFGFSRPNVIDDVTPVRLVTHGHLSTTDQGDYSVKLSVDSKQELSVDSRTVGLNGKDEMTIKSIATREAYYTHFSWPAATTQETLLFTSRVSPNLFGINGTEFHTLPVCFASLPFYYWTGSITFRMMIVATRFHRGRLKIVYDPGTITTTTVEDNLAFTKIIDIEDQHDFSFTVNWSQDKAYCRVKGLSSTPSFSTTAVLPVDRTYSNGVFSVYVVNELTAPALAPTNVDILLFAKAGDDIQFSVPTSTNTYTLSYFPTPPLTVQSGELWDNAPAASEEIEPIGSKIPLPLTINHQHFGETIVSFRTLLRRYHKHLTYTPLLTGTGSRYHLLVMDNYPPYYGPVPGGVHLIGTTPWNLVNVTLINYLTPAFVGVRGGIRYKIFRTVDDGFKEDHFTVSRFWEHNIKYLYSRTGLIDTTDQTTTASSARANEMTLFDGAHINTTDNGSVLEYELPYYDIHKFSAAKSIDRNVNPIGYSRCCHIISSKISSSTALALWQTAVATGEDFSLFFFTGAPIMYFQTQQ